jgi:alkylation response protein AidB-like acyl-CoA dehydrogenase
MSTNDAVRWNFVHPRIGGSDVAFESDRRPARTGSTSPSTLPDHLGERLPTLVQLFERDAAQVDASSVIPESHYAALADAGLYGSIVPASAGGLGLEMADITALVEELSAACLATTFVLIQHYRLQALMLDPATPEHLRALLPRIVCGELKGGISLGGSLPGPAKLLAARTGGEWRLNGEAMWVSGWGVVDLLVLTARGSDDSVHSFVVEAKEIPGLTARPLTLSAMNASATVRLAFDDVTLSDDSYVGAHPYSPGSEGVESLRTNGSLALGVARRCISLKGSTTLHDELQHCRENLDRATVSSMPDARAQACELALRSAHYLAVARGSSSALVGDVAERSSREAALLLVFGSRPLIKKALLERMESL